MLNDLRPWPAVYQQSLRWLTAGCFEALAQIDALKMLYL
jgi:hypothetical protein